MNLKRKEEEIPIHHFKDEDRHHFEFEHFESEIDVDSIIPHRHYYFELFIFKTGGGNHIIDFRTLKIEPMSVHIVAPGQVHHLKRINSCKGMVLMFGDAFISDNTENSDFISKFNYLEMEQISPAFRFSELEFNEILLAITAIEEETGSTDLLKMEVIRNYMNIILLRCRQHSEISEEKPSADMMLHAAFRKEVDLNFIRHKMVKDYALTLNHSEKKLNEVSKKYSGKSASAIIFSRIIKEAMRLMVHTEMSVKEICFNLEYDDPAHFTKFFKSQSGYAPSEFRKLYKHK